MDYNNLKQNQFQFVLDRIPNTVFRVVGCNVPSLQVEPPPAPDPSGMQYFPGQAPSFGELTIRFLLDENLESYIELFNWITLQRFAERKDTQTSDLVSDGFLVTTTNSSNPNIYFLFKDLFPIMLGEINFESTTAQADPVECTAVFKFSYFTIRRDRPN